MSPVAALVAAVRREGIRAAWARARCELEWSRGRRQGVPLVEPWPRVEVLHVVSREPHPARGGVERALGERLAATPPPWALLAPARAGLRLELRDQRGRRPVFRTPGVLDPATVVRLADLLGVRLIHLENLAPLDPRQLLPLVAGKQQLVLGLHDLGAFCPRPHLLDAARGVFCQFSRDPERCAHCLESGGHQAGDLAEVGSHELEAWRRAAGELLGRAAAVVVPSAWLGRELVAALRPYVSREPRIEVVAPATGAEVLGPPPVQCWPPRRLAVLGAFREDKGAHLVLEALAQLGRQGGGSPRLAQLGPIAPELAEIAHSTFDLGRGFYRPGTLGARLRALEIDLAVVASVVPESHSLVADEAWRAGVPLVAFDRGALGERIRELGGGLLVAASDEPTTEAGALAELLSRVLGGESERPQTPAPDRLPDPRQSASRLTRLYGELLG